MWLRALAILLWSGLASCAFPRAEAPVPVPRPPTLEERWGDRVEPSPSTLRILVPTGGERSLLPRNGHPLDFERELAVEFAQSRDLDIVEISIPKRRDLVPALQAGWGDLIVAGLTVTEERAAQVAFTVPITHAREQIVTRSDDLALTSEADLAGRRLAIRESSAALPVARQLASRHPGLVLDAVSEELDTEQVLYRVAAQRYDIAIADSNLVDAVLTYEPELRAAFDVSEDRPQAWAVRREDTSLLAQLDMFLSAALPGRAPDRYREDLSGLRKRKTLRVLTRNSGATYFVYRGQLLGFEYELAERFARSQGLHLELVVPPTRSALIPWLKEGRGDIVAASIVSTRQRAVQGVAFSEPYKTTREVVVARADDVSVSAREHLTGRTLVVRRSSSYWETAKAIQEAGIGVELVAAPEELETEEIIGRVAAGEYDLTIADSHIVDIELAWRKSVHAALPVSDDLGHRWVVRSGDTELLGAVDAFLEHETHSRSILNTLRRYFESPWRIQRYVRSRPSRSGAISPFDDLVKKYATASGFDWRLIVAQMYQESRFDPQAESPAGARGLMQFMAPTARRYGLVDRSHPEDSIRAGVRYLADLRDKEFIDLAAGERLWFALAAYNAGPGHVQDARRIASEIGLDASRWFGNVEEAMLLLARREFYRRARFGYCRGSEPFAYVREIRARYEAYRRATR